MFPGEIRRRVELFHNDLNKNGLEGCLNHLDIHETVRALRIIGAIQSASILKKAHRKFESWRTLSPVKRREIYGDDADAGQAFEEEGRELARTEEDLMQLVAQHEKDFGL
jgi:hypothetical protein